MSTEPLVSIIIPAFNARALIGETLDSVLAQTYGNLETIVVDDGSTDGTAEVVARYAPRVVYIRQEPSGGCAAPRNTAIQRSSGAYLCFLDADDLLTPQRLAIQIDFMERNPGVGLSFCDYRNFDKNGPFRLTHFQGCPTLQNKLDKTQELILASSRSHLVQENFGCAGTLLIRRKMLEVEELFDTSLRACEDFHYYFRLSRHTSIGIVTHVGLLRRLHGANLSGDALRMLTESVRSRTSLRDSEPDKVVRAHLVRHIADRQSMLGRHHAFHGRYVKAFCSYWVALRTQASWSQFRRTLRGIGRTSLIAMGMYQRKP